MAAPPLRIPVSLDLDSLKQQTQKASDNVGETLKGMGRAFTKVNGEILGVTQATATGSALAWAQSNAGTILRFTALASAAVAAYKIIGGVIDVTREKLEEMVAVADKSRDATVSAKFFQAFTSEAKNLKVSADDLGDALKKAFDATKAVSPVDLAKWETGEERITDVEKALRVYNETLVKAQKQTLEGLVLFRDADTQEKKVIAILEAMKQLNSIGQQAAALDLGEKMFGSKFVDNIRQGKTSAEGMLNTIKETSESSDKIFSDSVVARAKEIDDQLKKAQQRLDQELKPTWEGLANVMLNIKQLWSEVIDLVGKAVSISNKMDWTGLLTAINPGVGLAARLGGLISSFKSNPATSSLAADAGLNDIKTPSRGTGDAPTLKDTGGSTGRDRFDSSADAIQKRTAALEAENANINLGTEAREKAKIAAELETIAKQLNTEAGVNNGKVTEEQREKIDELSTAYGRAAAAIEKSHYPLQNWVRESSNLDKQFSQLASDGLNGLTNAIADVANGTKTLSDAFRSLATTVLTELEKIVIKLLLVKAIESAVSIFGGSTGGISGLSSLIKNANGGVVSSSGSMPLNRYAGGGVATSPQLAMFGEGSVPEAYVPLPDGRNIPVVMKGNGGGSGDMAISVSVDVSGARGDNEIEQMTAAAVSAGVRSGLKQYDAALPSRIKDINRRTN